MVNMNSKESAENKEPLLGEQSEYPNCPGCKNAHLTAEGAPLPIKELLMVASVVVCNAIPISSLYPFLYFMVDDFNIAKTSDDIGYYAGAIGSIFMFGRFLTSVHWGVFADKYGRRSVMALGLLSIMLFQPIFGMSKSFWVGFFSRFLLGAFNGMLGPLKAYASEICSVDNQAWGLTVVSTSWSLGLIVGPALGGFLARPAVNFPGYFASDSFFGRYPYLLPCLCNAVFAAVELFVVYHLSETVHRHDDEPEVSVLPDVEQTLVAASEFIESPKRSLWLNWPLMASVAVYCTWSLHDIAFSEVFSMWCVAPVETDGLGMLTSNLGVVLAISGFGMLCVQLALFPPLAKRFGPTLVARIPALLVLPLVVLFPFVSAMEGTMQWIVLNALALLRNTFSTMVVTGSFLMVNNAVPASERGEANGISLSCVSLFRAIGPAAAGAFFAWGQSRHNTSILPGSEMVFFILDILCVVALFTMIPPFLPKEVDYPYEAEPEHVVDEKLASAHLRAAA